MNTYGKDPSVRLTTTPSPDLLQPTVGTTADSSALAVLKAELEKYGLGALADRAWQKMSAGETMDAILVGARETDVYKQRFAGNIARKKAGLTPLSEAEYLSYEQGYRDMLKAHGLDTAKYGTQTALANVIGADVSVAEANQRVTNAAAWRDHVLQTNPLAAATAAALKDYYGIDAAQLTDLFLDPKADLTQYAAKLSAPTGYGLQQAAQAATIGGQAHQAGFGALTAQEAASLAAQGITADQANKGFGDLYAQRELFQVLPGEGTGAIGNIDHQRQLDLAFNGDPKAAEAVQMRARARAMRFQEGGDFQGSNQGALGLRTTNAPGV